MHEVSVQWKDVNPRVSSSKFVVIIIIIIIIILQGLGQRPVPVQNFNF
jgi:hypothetical protein